MQARGIIPALAVLAALAALWPSLSSLLAYWQQIQDYQHGLLLAPLAGGWLLWSLWKGAARDSVPSVPAVAALALVLLGWVVAVRSDFDIVHQLLWPLALMLVVAAVGGAVVALRLSGPLALLYFAVPVWDYALPVLQRLSVFCSEHLLALLGVPATVTEFRVTIPEGTFAIVEGCSGKRFFVVSLAVAWMGANLLGIRGRRLLIYLACAGVLSMITNWVRIVIVIYLGHVSNMQHYVVAVEHITLGNVMYVALLLAILMLGRWLGRGEGEKPAVSPLVPLPSRRLMTTAVPAILLLALAGFVARIQASESADATLDGWPLATGRWQGPLPPATTWVPRFAASHNERRAAYSSTLGVVEIYSNLYQFQAKGRELIQYENNIVAPEEWVRPWGFSSETIAGRSGDLGAFQMVGPGGREWIVAYTYRVGERLYNRDYAAKLAYGWYSLLGGTPSGVVAMAAACNPGNCDHARALVADFWDDMHPPLLAMLHTTE